MWRDASHSRFRRICIWVCGLNIFFYVMIYPSHSRILLSFLYQFQHICVNCINRATYYVLNWSEKPDHARHTHEINLILKFDIMHQIQISLTMSTIKERAYHRKGNQKKYNEFEDILSNGNMTKKSSWYTRLVYKFKLTKLVSPVSPPNGQIFCEWKFVDPLFNKVSFFCCDDCIL